MPSIDLPSGTPIVGALALVTGGNRGFGRAVVDELPERGAAKVYATSRSSQPARAVKSQLSQDVTALCTQLTVA